MRVVTISDTHNDPPLAHTMPEGDVLVHAGDATFRGSIRELTKFNAWLMSLPYKHKIFVPGNHDLDFDARPADTRKIFDPSIHILIEQSVEIDGVVFWGSPMTPEFGDWAFGFPDWEGELIWATMPDKVDVVITHGPPLNILDLTARGEAVGCPKLRDRIRQVKPKLHVFGHIHECGGQSWTSAEGTKHVNAAYMDERYDPAHNPRVFTV